MTPPFPTSFWLLLLPLAIALHAMLRVAQGIMCRRWDGFVYWSWRSLIGTAFLCGVVASVFRFTYIDIGAGSVLVMALMIRGRLNRQLDRQLLLSVVTSASNEQQRNDALVSIVNRASGWTRRHAKRILRKVSGGQAILAVAGRRTARRDIDKVLLRAGNQPIAPSIRDTLLRRIRNLDMQLDATIARLQGCFSLFATGPVVILYHVLLIEIKEVFEQFPSGSVVLFNAFASNTPLWLLVKIFVAILLLSSVTFLIVRSIAPGLFNLPPLMFIRRGISRSLTLTTISQLVAANDTLSAINITSDIVESKRERGTLKALKQLVGSGLAIREAAFRSGLLPSKFRAQGISLHDLRLLDNAAVLFEERLIGRLKFWASVTVVGYTLLVSAVAIAHGLVFVHAFAQIIQAIA